MMSLKIKLIAGMLVAIAALLTPYAPELAELILDVVRRITFEYVTPGTL